jgi:NAD+ synthase (glutamine-hydrolysing)
MKLALLQLNATTGDLEGNARRITRAMARVPADTDLCVTPEMSLTGYPARDLLLNPSFVSRVRAVAEALAREMAHRPPLLVGLPEPNPASEGRPLFNAAALLEGGHITRWFRKSLLPTYDVFDEDRYFEPASDHHQATIAGRQVAVSICEDIWNDRDFWRRRRYHHDPIEIASRAGANLLVNVSASPFATGKQALRERMLGQLARKHGLPVAYVNQVGGNDDLVFDGRSAVFASDGRLVARAAAFAEDVLVVALDDALEPVEPTDLLPEAEIYAALVLGTRDYARKCGFPRALLGLSGGVDSALVAVIAAEALGPENVLGVTMPSPFSSRGSVEDAEDLARRLGMTTLALPIAGLMERFDQTLSAPFAGLPRDVTEENVQARIRGNLLMALSNKFGSLLLTTGNKSELAVGYCTLYGDMSGGLAVIADVPKTMVYRVARWVNAARRLIPERILVKPPSAELRPDQTDQDSLPPYELLDAILERHIEGHASLEALVAEGFEEETVRRVLRLVRTAEFKRKQAAPGLKVTDRAFGSGWRMPIAAADWEAPQAPGRREGLDASRRESPPGDPAVPAKRVDPGLR